MPARPVPSTNWYLLAIIPFAIGTAINLREWFDVADKVHSAPRLEVPGERTVELEARRYTVFTKHEGDATACQLSHRQTGEVLEHRPTNGDGREIFDVHVQRAGEYTLACTGAPGTVTISPRLRVKRLALGSMVVWLAAIPLVVVWRRRRRPMSG